MRKDVKLLAVAAMLSLPVCSFAADSSKAWYNPKNWFSKNKSATSTTVTGNVDSIIKDQVFFKTLDGQTLLLLGNKAGKVGECGNAKVRVFGNVYTPSDKYPAGALQVRNYRVLEEAVKAEETTPEPVAEPEPYVEASPEPIAEPVAETVTETTSEPSVEVEAVTTQTEKEDVIVEIAEESSQEATKKVKLYVVKSGDTLGKISSKMLGSATKWKEIAKANNITNPKHLKVGMTLQIPEN